MLKARQGVATQCNAPTDLAGAEVMDLGLPMSRGLEDKGGGSLDERRAQACAEGLESYRDPATGYRVFTALPLQKRSSTRAGTARLRLASAKRSEALRSEGNLA